MKQKTSTTIRDESGAFDLPSILTGVVVVGVLTAGVLASVFGVIPYAQDSGAKQDLSAVSTAQGTSKTKAGTYRNFAALAAGKLLPSGTDPLKIDAKQTTSGGWAAAARSGSGKVFLATASDPNPRDVTGVESCTPAALATPAVYVFQTLDPLKGMPSARATGDHLWTVTAINALGETIASDSTWQYTLDTTQNMQLTISGVPGATGYKIYRSATADAADARLLTTVDAPPTFEDPSGKYGPVWNWTDDGSLTPGADAPPVANTTGDATPTCIAITDVASALASKE